MPFMIVLGTLGYGAEATRVWIAEEFAASSDPELWRRAARLEPGNASYWAQLGSAAEWDFAHEDSAQAAAYYEKAVRTNPLWDRHWLELAALYERMGEALKARRAYEEARAAHPVSAEVGWRYGNFLLRQGDAAGAAAQFRQAVQSDPGLMDSVIAVSWKSDLYDPGSMAELLPPQSGLYFRLLEFFSQQQKTQAALRVWDLLVTLRQPMEVAQAIPLVEYLISTGEVAEAQRVWAQALDASRWPHDAPADASVVFNGGFENDLAAGGFDWRKQNDPHVTFAFDRSTYHSGSRSLRIDFDGEANIDFQHLCETVAVEPRKSYRLTAYLKSSGISTDREFLWMIFDPRNPRQPPHSTAGILGTQPWTRLEVEFTADAETRIAQIVLRRIPSAKFDNKLRGTLWIDDVSLVALAKQKGRR
jgi:Carbohydrate binding domain